MKKLSALLLIAFFGVGCAPMTLPILRHETGELLAPGQKRVHGHLEKGATFPLPPPTSVGIGVAQSSAIYSANMLGVGGAVGILPRLEGKVDTYWTDRGAGWRLGFKTPLAKVGTMSAAFTLKYGNFSGTGSYDVEDSSGAQVAEEQTLSGRVFDLGFPLSAKIWGVTAYTGLGWQRVWLKGRTDSVAVTNSQTILNWNLGTRFKLSGALEGDVELALAKRADPFMEGSSWMPYFGFSVGLPF